MFSINYGKDERDYLERKLLDLPCSRVANAKIGGIIEAALTNNEDALDKDKSLAQVKKDFPNCTDEINFLAELIKDKSSKFGKQFGEYLKLTEKFDKLPDYFKRIFSVDEILKAKADRFEDIDESIAETISQKDYDAIEKAAFSESGLFSIVRSLDLTGPDDLIVMSMYKKFDGDDTLSITGKIRFCVYGDIKKKFPKLLRTLDSYRNGNIQIYDSDYVGDTYGISMDAVNNTADTQWMRACYSITYKI